MYGWNITTSLWPGSLFIGNFVSFATTGYLSIDQDQSIICFNTFSGGTGANVRFVSGADRNICIGNVMAVLPTDGVGTNIIQPNAPEVPYVTLSSATTALAFATNRTVQNTPNSTRTYTTTVPPAGTKCQLVILTSGTTSYTLTFGTGFKTVGTLATGTTSARRFIMEFISDGTQLIETSRTAAIA